jgi:PRC-barrel domain
MAKVKYISSPSEIPVGEKYVLVTYGEEYAQTTHPLGLNITVARTVSELSFLTAVHTAKGIAKNAGISKVFVCTGTTPGPNLTPIGMFTYVPAHDELSSNVVGLDVYDKDEQNIGTIKDIALDASGLNGYIIDVGGFLGMGELCCRAPVGNQLRCQGQQMACHNERGTLISSGRHQNTNTPANPDHLRICSSPASALLRFS